MRLLYLFTFLLFTSCGGSSASDVDDYDKLPENSEFKPGKAVYDRACVACHMKDGNGLEGTFPPLCKSDYMLEDPKRALKQVVFGSDDKMTVNGLVYETIMPAQDVSDEEALAVVNYILNAWGNDGGKVTQSDLDEVKKNN
jgi:mono/diheme cytochrome c family protein